MSNGQGTQTVGLRELGAGVGALTDFGFNPHRTAYVTDLQEVTPYHTESAINRRKGILVTRKPQSSGWRRARRRAMTVAILVAASLGAVPAVALATGSISGTVYDAGQSGHPAYNVPVSVYDTSGSVVGSACTFIDGKFTVVVPSAGSYRVGFATAPICAHPYNQSDQPPQGPGNYVPQYYNNKGSLATADPVSVTGTSDTSLPAISIQSGGVTGTIYLDSSAPAADVPVVAYDSNGNVVRTTCTTTGGTYRLFGLATGTYRIGANTVPGDDTVNIYGGGGPPGNPFACQPKAYLPRYYNLKWSLATADPVSVTAGSTASGIDGVLHKGGHITGTVTDASTHTAIQNISVHVYDSGGTDLGSVCTDASGNYKFPGPYNANIPGTVTGIAYGNYRVGFGAGCGVNKYQTQFYNGKASLATADSVTVSTDGDYAANAAMQEGGYVTGTVTDAATHSALQNMSVDVYDSGGTDLQSVCTTANGTYTLQGLPTGTYRVGFNRAGTGAACAPLPYVPQFYNAASSLATANTVSVTAPSTTTGVNAAMVAQHTLSVSITGAGTVSGNQSPAISCPGACSQAYPNNTQVTLTATPTAGSTFAGWSGGGCSGTATSCTVALSADKTVTAAFTTPPPPTGGTGTPPPTGGTSPAVTSPAVTTPVSPMSGPLTSRVGASSSGRPVGRTTHPPTCRASTSKAKKGHKKKSRGCSKSKKRKHHKR